MSSLRAGLTQKSDEDHVEEIDSKFMWIGVRSGYAMKHQRGEGVPQRKLIQLTDPQKLRWVQIARRVTWESLRDAAEDAGLKSSFKERLAREE